MQVVSWEATKWLLTKILVFLGFFKCSRYSVHWLRYKFLWLLVEILQVLEHICYSVLKEIQFIFKKGCVLIIPLSCPGWWKTEESWNPRIVNMKMQGTWSRSEVLSVMDSVKVSGIQAYFASRQII